jgi:uncharacterized repeat protein (TIGR02543 family)
MKSRLASLLSALVVVTTLQVAILPTSADAASLQSITLLGGKTDASHPLGGYSQEADVSLDDGSTWVPAYLALGNHPWPKVSGTDAWLSACQSTDVGTPAGANCANRTFIFRHRFFVASDFDTATVTYSMNVDDIGQFFLNGRGNSNKLFDAFTGNNGVYRTATNQNVQSLLVSGWNTFYVVLTGLSGHVGINYKTVLSYYSVDAPIYQAPVGKPGSPTIGTPSIIDSTTVSVPFSPPASDGGSAITSYRVTSYPRGKTGTSASSPISISGLTTGSPETFTVVAISAFGTSESSTASAVITPRDRFTANFNAQGGSSVSSASYYTNESVTAPSSTTLSGYTFNGWFESTTAGSAVTFPYSNSAPGSFTLYAQWSALPTYTVDFNSSGGNAISSGSFISGGTVVAPASSPVKSGHTFNGWFVAASGGSAITFPYAPGVTNNITLYAQWAPIDTGPAPVVLGPPPSTFVLVERPKISRSGTSLVCSSGTFKFKKQGGPEEASKISSQQISLLSNGAVVDSEKTLEPQSTFEGKSSYKGTTLSCEVGIKQEEVVKTFSSLDKDSISSLEAAMTASVYGANTTYYSERDAAYMKRDAGDTKLWKELLDKALFKREDTKVQAGVDYLANLEKAGISILIALDKAAPAPTPVPAPTPTPTPTKSPEVSVTGNVQPAAMKKVGTIYFASGTYFLNDESKKTIKALATSIFMKSPATVLSYGFTDSKGGADNTLLSQNRAKAVAKLLRSLLPGQKIATGWYASSKPVATGTSKAALAKNRRVEIYIK